MNRAGAIALPFLAGVLFALGLGIAGMTLPAKVSAFLDFLGAWDPSLAFVMGGALLVHLPFVMWLRRRHPSLDPAAPPGRVDRALLLGAAIFGIGWGLSGLCPGPAFVVLARGDAGPLVFVAALFAGMALLRAPTIARPARPGEGA